jgi:hypothetical protein
MLWRRIVSFNQLHKLVVWAAITACCLIYFALYVLPRHVSFSYAGPTCQFDMAFLPGMNKAANATQFDLDYRGGIALGKVQLISTRTCFIPQSAPKKGIARIAGAPFGGWLFRTHYRVAVGAQPRVVSSVLPAQPLSKPMELRLTQPDKVFDYYLSANKKIQQCKVQSTRLRCAIDKLGLKQGASYDLSLQSRFGTEKVKPVSDVKVAILSAPKVTSSSIKPEEVVLIKPQSADFIFDRPIVKAESKLEMLEGGQVLPVAVRLKTDGTRILVTWDTLLPRDKTFRITLTSAIAGDGSMLDGAYGFNFRTSGGPKVIGVSIGGAGVVGNARAIVTFDQTLAKDTNITSVANINGGSATISRVGTNQIAFALNSLPPCTAFTLNIAKGIMSEHGIASEQGWSHASRVNCRSTRTIGYSVNGKPIQAYFYGSGPSTVLFTGGIHGDEPSGTYIMQDWAAHLDTNGYKIPAGRQVVIVPNINPDGIAINKRYNAHNVNLDRNFPTSDWVSDIALRNGQILHGGGGSTPLSEPETQAIANLTSSLQLRTMISFHSSGALVGANKVSDSITIGNIYASAVGYTTMFYNAEEIMGYTLTGEYEIWIGEKFGAPAILVELPTSTGRYFSRHQNVLWRMVGI